MTDTEIRIAVAEAMGWKRGYAKKLSKTGLRLVTWITPEGEKTSKWPIIEGSGELGYLPDYPNDLNAILQEVKNVLKPEAYASRLLAVLHRDLQPATNLNFVSTTMMNFYCATATARQHCEALLRLHEKWKE
jgi:hypothetical protein